MPSFRNDPAEWQRTDWRLLQNGFVHLFWSNEVLDQTIDGLSEEGYTVIDLDTIDWIAPHDALREIGRAFDFPEYSGRNLDALGDCLGDVANFRYGSDPTSTGTVLILRHVDRFRERQPEVAQALLDIFAHCGRSALLIGHPMLCLVQSDAPDIDVAVVGAAPISWNPAEFPTAKRHPNP